MWIPGSSVSEARLEAATGEQTVSDSRSLVTSPVVLAVRPQLKSALAQQNWSTLPGLQTNPTAMDGLNLSGWGSLRLALPLTGDSDATYLAAEAVATTSAPPGAPATAGIPAVSTLMAGQPKLADTKAATALDALLQADDPATRAGARRGQHRTADLPTWRVAARRQGQVGLLASARPHRRRGLSDRIACRHLAFPGAGECGQRVRQVSAQGRTAWPSWPRRASAPTAARPRRTTPPTSVRLRRRCPLATTPCGRRWRTRCRVHRRRARARRRVRARYR